MSVKLKFRQHFESISHPRVGTPAVDWVPGVILKLYFRLSEQVSGSWLEQKAKMQAFKELKIYGYNIIYGK